MNKIISAFTMMFSMATFAHEEHHYAPHSTEQKKTEIKSDLQLVYKNINADYLKEVKPTFDQKCAACHSSISVLPWYASVPPASWIIKADRAEAQEHLEISQGFPFKGHGTSLEDLKAIKVQITNGKMPTFFYVLFHPSHGLTEQEKNTILGWVDRSQKRLVKVIP